MLHNTDTQSNIIHVPDHITKVQISSTATIIPKPITTTDTRCSICMEHVRIRTRCTLRSCGHVFHTTCIQIWLVVRNTCPNCNTIASPCVEHTHGHSRAVMNKVAQHQALRIAQLEQANHQLEDEIMILQDALTHIHTPMFMLVPSTIV